MEENLEPNIKVNNEVTNNTNKSNLDEIKKNKSEKDFNMYENIRNSENKSPKVETKNAYSQPDFNRS